MIRYILAVLLTVALIGGSIGAINEAADIRSENSVQQTIDRIEAAAQSLMAEETLAPRDVDNPERKLTLSFPTDSLTSTKLESAKIDQACGGESVARYQIEGNQRQTEVIEAPIQTIKGGPVPLGGERTRATLKLGRDQYNNKVVFFIWRDDLQQKNSNYDSGLHYEYYEAKSMSMNKLIASNQIGNGTIGHFYLPPEHRPEHFGVRYTGYIEVPKNGTYKFYLTSNDSSKLWIDGTLVIDNGGMHPAKTESGSIELQKGRHEIRADYINQLFHSNLSIKYEGPCIEKQEIPQRVLIPDPGWTNPGPTSPPPSTPGSTPTPTPTPTPAPPDPGLHYEYHEVHPINLGELDSSTKVSEGSIGNFDVPSSSRENDFGVIYTGNIEIPGTGDYTFYLTSDDGSKLWIDGTLVVDNGGHHGPNTEQGRIRLDKGTHDIKAGYFNGGGGGTFTVKVEGPNIQGKIEIPAGALTHDE